MLKPLKIVHPEHDVWVISDLHIGHNRHFIIEPRQFKTIEEHDESIIHRWNDRLTNRSVVINLGDVVFNDPDGARFKGLMRRLNFATHYLLIGNHTSGHRQVYIETLAARFPDAVKDGRLEYEVYPLEYYVDDNPNKKVVFLPEYADISVGGHRYSCCHYPIISHNGLAKFAIGLFGHSHGGCELTNKDTGKGLRLDVGIESFGRPINLTEVKRHLAGRDIDSVDHHGENTN